MFQFSVSMSVSVHNSQPNGHSHFLCTGTPPPPPHAQAGDGPARTDCAPRARNNPSAFSTLAQSQFSTAAHPHQRNDRIFPICFN